MGESRTLYAIAESCPFDALLVRDMRKAVDALLQLNLKRFRVPGVSLAKYSALDVMKQALELLYEFSPSEKNYREAVRTIQVYSESDEEMKRTVQASFRLFANAVYNAYSGQRHAQDLAPEILFLQGVPFDPNELQKSFRYVGVRPPELTPTTVKNVVFLDAGFEPYKLLLDGKTDSQSAQMGREEHWANVIKTTLEKDHRPALLKVGKEHLEQSRNPIRHFAKRVLKDETGKLPVMLLRDGIRIEIAYRIADVNETFARKFWASTL